MTLKTLPPETHLLRDHGAFQVRRIHPGRIFGPEADQGFGGLGLVDDATLATGLTVALHEHRDDEIVSYLREGELLHLDNAGHRETVRPDRVMVMNAGSGFSHEERVPGPPVRMLQIFIRPSEPGLPPRVQFADLDPDARLGRWRLLVGPHESEAPAFVRQEVYLFDAHLAEGQSLTVPERDRFDPWLYLFSGRVRVGDRILPARWAATGAFPGAITADETSDLVLALVNRSAQSARTGTLSG